MRRLAAVALCLAFPLAASFADMPSRTEELAWSVIAFNGWDYSATLAPAAGPTVWLMAGVDNFVTLRKTFVYWWPLTAQWMADTQTLNVLLEGTLEVRPAGRSTPVRKLELVTYTYYNIRGDYELNWRVATGEAAARELERYHAMAEVYLATMERYQQEVEAWEQEQGRLKERIRLLQERGGDASRLIEELGGLRQPVEPPQPRAYAVPPSQPQLGFVVNLPEGAWDARLVAPDGSLVEGSTRRIVAWSKSRTGQIGYEVIPGDRWTRTQQSATPSSVLYVDGSADLYLQPYFEDEVNDLCYEKTIDNSGRGSGELAKWVRIQQVPKSRLEMVRGGAAPETIIERSYVVQQAEGASLGYTIIPFDAEGAHRNGEPDLKAFLLPVKGSFGSIRIRTLDEKREPLAGSSREVRIVRGLPLAPLCIGLAFVPLAAMVVVMVIRSRRYRR
jgi:hypothetical protein